MKRPINTDLYAAIIGFVIMGMFWLAGRGVGHLSILFPNALLLLIGVFSAVLLIKALVRADRNPIFNEGNQTRIIITGIALLVWVVAIMYVGFLTTSLVMFPVMVCFLASARQKLTLKKVSVWSAISASEVLVFYFIFTKFLQVPLPKGMLV
mgnify:CR=1 FL=1